MKAILAGAALAAACYTPALADYYIVQNPTTKTCTIVEQRPANPSIGIIIGGDMDGTGGSREPDENRRSLP